MGAKYGFLHFPLLSGPQRLTSRRSIVVEFAKESRPKRDVYEADRAPRARRPPGIRLVVSGISRDTSWQVRSSFVFRCPRDAIALRRQSNWPMVRW